MTGRIVVSSYESLRATGTSVVCLSPWGDSSPLLLPCIRFRDLVVHTVVAVTGGAAAIATPVMVSLTLRSIRGKDLEANKSHRAQFPTSSWASWEIPSSLS